MPYLKKLVITLATGTFALSLSSPVMAQDGWPTRLTVQGAYPGTVPLLGTAPKKMTETIEALSGSQVQMRWQEPNAIVPPQQVFDAVSTGALDASWGTPGDWSGKDSAFTLFTSVPFGPQSVEYIAWIKHGGGNELMNELFSKYNITALPCGVVPSEASGWFKKEITSVEELNGLKMRFFGLGGRVMEKFGVATQLLPAGEIFQSLQLGTIDATEFAVPSMDVNLGFEQVAQHYYFPGWHQPTSLNVLMINKDKWNAMSDEHKNVIRKACDDVIVEMLFEGESVQGAALTKIRESGAMIHVWSDEILAALKEKWEEVAEEEKAGNPMFGRALESLATFRDEFGQWKELSKMRQ